MANFKNLLTSIVLLGTISLPAYGFKSSAVSFVATANPGFLTIEGKGAKLESLTIDKGEKVSGIAVALLKGLTTEMDTRDEHMHEKYLETAKYPKATLVFEGKAGVFTGTLEIKGEKKPVAGVYDLKGDKLTASFKFKIGDYPTIGVPSWLGVTIADEVEVKVRATL